MNIFVLDKNPIRAAKYHCNSHVIKLIIEGAQMLSTAHWVTQLGLRGRQRSDFKRVRDMQEWLFQNVPRGDQPPYKMSHINHPCTLWTLKSTLNYQWLSDLSLALCSEYTERYGKVHKTQEVLEWLDRRVPQIPDVGLTPHPQCVPDDCKVPGDPVAAYRDYYNRYKNHFAKWEPRARRPQWYKG